jgi:hypothetical protein
MIKLGNMKIDPGAIGSQGNAILGIRDSGKTYTATVLAEKLFESGIPFIAFDPIGVWRFLRVPGKGKGYPIVVAGGQEGDLPLTVAGAPEIVRAAMANGISLVIDLFDINLSKADWKRIVTACVRVLLHENSKHGLRHVFIEEAAEFAPQRVGPDQGQVYAEMEKLARMGGNSRLGYTLINQRAEEVNKALLELCDNLFLHRQKGRNSLTALSKWLDIGNVSAAKEIVATLPTLPTGECWAWLAGSETPELLKVPAKNSLHPDRRIMRGDENITRKAVDVGSFVSTMRGTLKDVEQESKTLDEMKKEIARLKVELKRAVSFDEEKARATIRASVIAEFNAQDRERKRVTDELYSLIKFAFDHADLIREKLAFPPNTPGSHAIDSPRREAPLVSPPTRPQRGPRPAAADASAAGATGLPKGEQVVLTAIAQHPDGVTREQLTVLTGYKRSTRDAYIQRMRERGVIESDGDRILATDAGFAALGPSFEPLPTGSALADHWLQKLPEGESRILRILLDRAPGFVERDKLSELTGYARSSRDAYLQRLSARQLIRSERGAARASENLL